MGAPADPVPPEVLDVFAGRLRIGHLATRRPDGDLAVVPVGVMIHEGQVRISSRTDTRKIRNLEHDPHVGLCITDPDDPRHYLAIRGTAEVAEDTGRSFVDWMARTHMGQETYPYEPQDAPRSVITIREATYVLPRVQGSD